MSCFSFHRPTWSRILSIIYIIYTPVELNVLITFFTAGYVNYAIRGSF